MMECIISGIEGDESEGESYASEVIDSAELGYCELFDFKCAADRTCSAWLVGGSIKTEMTKAQKNMLKMAKFQYGNKENENNTEED
jgi:hypothetical protein